jgi:hypothetical protein
VPNSPASEEVSPVDIQSPNGECMFLGASRMPVLRAIFREAVEQDFLPKDPARTVKSPSELKESDKTTLAKDKGHVKDIQGMMRHSRLATTTEVYMQSLEDAIRSTVNSIHDELSGTGTVGAKPTAKHSMPDRGRQQNAAKAAGSATKLLQRAGSAKPVRGVILEFATRMRQSRLGRVDVSD